MKISFIQKNKKYLLVVAGIVGLLFLRSFILRKPSEELTYVIERGTLSETVKVSGVYTAASQTEVFSTSDGIIIELYVKNNEEVEKGDPLFYIESTATDEQRAVAYATYQTALTALSVPATQNLQWLRTAQATIWRHKLCRWWQDRKM